uniref:Temporin-1Ja n=2 Tax=Rana japonica TaxID=8402 RepID=TP1A_RANJA|nr:RecName: Full=Temporin-1Ja [Rana japonica]
ILPLVGNLLNDLL